jgi:hypothetical protein
MAVCGGPSGVGGTEGTQLPQRLLQRNKDTEQLPTRPPVFNVQGPCPWLGCDVRQLTLLRCNAGQGGRPQTSALHKMSCAGVGKEAKRGDLRHVGGKRRAREPNDRDSSNFLPPRLPFHDLWTRQLGFGIAVICVVEVRFWLSF